MDLLPMPLRCVHMLTLRLHSLYSKYNIVCPLKTQYVCHCSIPQLYGKIMEGKKVSLRKTVTLNGLRTSQIYCLSSATVCFRFAFYQVDLFVREFLSCVVSE